MANLYDQVEKLREIGIDYGLSDYEIDRCFLDVLSNDADLADKSRGPNRGARAKQPSAVETKGKAQHSFLRSCVKVAACLFLAGVAAVVTLSVLMSVSDPVQLAVEKTIQPLAYPVFRLIRLATLPLARLIDLSAYYDSQCLIHNPFHTPPPVECHMYKKTNKVDQLDKLSVKAFERKYLGHAKSFVLKNGLGKSINYQGMRDVYFEYEDMLRFTPKSEIECSDPRVTSYSYLMRNMSEATLKKNPLFDFKWTSDTVGASYVLRLMFPRPLFIDKSSEVHLTKALFVDSSKSKSYTLPSRLGPNLYYVQGSGSRTFVFVPDAACFEQDKAVQVTLHAGDVMYIHSLMWRIDSVPAFNEKPDQDLSIGFLAAFS